MKQENNQLLVVPSTGAAAAALNVDYAGPLPLHVRFADLRHARIVMTRKHLDVLQKRCDFPKGKMIGPNTRAWTYDEIMVWLKARPTDRKAMPEDAHRPKRQPSQAADGAAAAE